jgi:uncharacterized protein YdhG (YjbR/CyaY superfamily)
MNAAWHKSHPMPKNATSVERLAWHRAHADACGCRQPPPDIREALQRAGGTTTGRARTRRAAAATRSGSPTRSRATKSGRGSPAARAARERKPAAPRASRPKPGVSIDAYLASVAPDARAVLQTLRRTIAAAAPQAEEGSSYGLPAFRMGGRPLVAFAAAARHCSLFPMSPAVIRTHAAALAGFDTSKGTIRFTPDRPLPEKLVRALVKTRLDELGRS